jgi:hypothetical protein
MVARSNPGMWSWHRPAFVWPPRLMTPYWHSLKSMLTLTRAKCGQSRVNGLRGRAPPASFSIRLFDSIEKRNLDVWFEVDRAGSCGRD